MKNILATFSIITLFYGCASVELPQEEGWAGRNFNTLIVAWGTPFNTSDFSDGRKVARFNLAHCERSRCLYSASEIIDGLSYYCNIDVFVEPDNTVARMDHIAEGGEGSCLRLISELGE
jgi:hypothetical protein